jgi:endo-1,4-beta-xylanase
MNIKKSFAFVISCCLFLHCTHTNKLPKQNRNAQTKGLKDYYKNYFRIGVSVTPGNLSGDEGRLVLQQFNSLTPENAMKMGPIHPKEDEYFWRDA